MDGKLHLGIFVVTSICLGVYLGVLGPSLTDLQRLLGVDHLTINYIFLGQGLGGLVLAPLSLLAIQRWHPCGLLSALCCVIALWFVLLPISRNIYLSVLITVVSAGVTESSLAAILFASHHTWPHSPAIFHVIFASSGVGELLAPLVMDPFLSEGAVTLHYKSYSLKRVQKNETGKWTQSENVSSWNGTSVNMSSDQFVTLIEIPYLMFACLAFISAIGTLYLYKTTPFHMVPPEYKELENNNTLKPGRLFMVLAGFLLLFLQGIMYVYGMIIPIYATNSRLHLSQSRAAVMNSVFWLSSTVGRILAVLISKWLRQSWILVICTAGCWFGTGLITCSLITGLNGETFMWCASVCFGIFSGPMISAGMAWLVGHVYLTPIINVITTVAISSATGLSFVCGVVMGYVGNDGFIYFLWGTCATVSLLGLVMRLYFRTMGV